MGENLGSKGSSYCGKDGKLKEERPGHQKGKKSIERGGVGSSFR